MLFSSLPVVCVQSPGNSSPFAAANGPRPLTVSAFSSLICVVVAIVIIVVLVLLSGLPILFCGFRADYSLPTRPPTTTTACAFAFKHYLQRNPPLAEPSKPLSCRPHHSQLLPFGCRPVPYRARPKVPRIASPRLGSACLLKPSALTQSLQRYALQSGISPVQDANPRGGRCVISWVSLILYPSLLSKG